MRTATVHRQTNETDIRLTLNLDGSGQHDIATGIGFLDHMLTHVAVHGLFDLALKANGDLAVDAHHTIEDTALALGQALAEALGDKRGLARMGSAYVPMDEALAFVAVDLSGRPYAVVNAVWHGPAIGPFPRQAELNRFPGSRLWRRVCGRIPSDARKRTNEMANEMRDRESKRWFAKSAGEPHRRIVS